MTPGPPENDQSCVKSEVATSGKRGERGEELEGGWGVHIGPTLAPEAI